MSEGLLGTTGDLTGQDLVEALRNLKCSGTLALSEARGSVLLQLARGQVEATYKLGHYGSLDDPRQGYHLYPHEPAPYPRLPSRLPASAAALLRVLPRVSPPTPLPSGLVDLRALLDGLQERAFHGALSFVREGEAAVALLLRGQVAAAVHERGEQVHERAEAMRALQRAGMDAAGPPLELDPLDPAIVRSLVGLALGRAADVPDPSTFSGLHLADGHARFLRNGQPYLTVACDTPGPPRRYALLEDDGAQPQLQLPDEPPGWEEQRYALTLRGQDALNPMTELSMHFRTSFGRTGQTVLEALGRGRTLEETAQSLQLELQELKPWLKRLEGEGLVRANP